MRLRPVGATLLGLVLVGCLVSCSNDTGGSVAPSSSQSFAVLEQQTHAKVNEYRVSRALTPLTWSDVIAAQAQRHSRDMATRAATFGHDGFNDRLASIAQAIPWSSAAENVAMLSNRSDPVDAAVTGWLNSPGHRENIEGNFNMTGVGIAQAADGAFYFTQIFVKAR